MKNQYFGDISDYSKFVLMTALIPSGLKLGVNWYLTNNDGKTDGKHIDYLTKSEFYNSDSELCDFLKHSIDQDRRNINEIKGLSRFSNIKFYGDLLDIVDISSRTTEGRNERLKKREEWFKRSLRQLSDRDLVFCDPDNGIASDKMKPAARNSVKYVFSSEVGKMIDAGFSLVIYNHRDRSKEKVYFDKLRNSYRGKDAIKTRVIRFNRYSVRDYIFLIQINHQKKIDSALNEFLNNINWNKYFKEIDL